MSENIVYLCIGGNEGDREANLEETMDFIYFNFGDILCKSSVYESEAWGMQDAPAFLNQVVKISTELTPEEIMQEISELEEYYGRTRKANEYVSRKMDVDLLFYNNEVRNTTELTLPHPRLHLRKFVLQPLAEIAADFIHPLFQKDIVTLLKECDDSLQVKKL